MEITIYSIAAITLLAIFFLPAEKLSQFNTWAKHSYYKTKDWFNIKYLKQAHEHHWEFTHTDHLRAKRYKCIICDSTGARHPHHHYDMYVIERSEKAKKLPHKHVWCFEMYAGRKMGAPESTPMSKMVSCECEQWAVLHHGETEYVLLADTKKKQVEQIKYVKS